MIWLVICQDETVKVTCKNCDKFMYYIDRVSACCSVDHGIFLSLELSPLILVRKWAREVFVAMELSPFAKTNASGEGG